MGTSKLAMAAATRIREYLGQSGCRKAAYRDGTPSSKHMLVTSRPSLTVATKERRGAPSGSSNQPIPPPTTTIVVNRVTSTGLESRILVLLVHSFLVASAEAANDSTFLEQRLDWLPTTHHQRTLLALRSPDRITVGATSLG